MRARLRSWWQKIRRPIQVIVFIAMLVVAIALILVEIRLYGTGLAGKTLWDWLQLLIIPLVLAIIALLFNLANSRTERQIAEQRYKQDQKIALDKQRQDLLQTYLDRMTALLLDKDLCSSQPDAPVRNVARAGTLTVLPQLNAQRKGKLIQFLSESKLLEIISLQGADLSDADLLSVKLSDADLLSANLSDADLRYALLEHADLSDADLSGADLIGANLREGILSKANLKGANLSGTDLIGANLWEADLSKANLSGANLSEAILWEAILSKAILSKANLRGANLRGTILWGPYQAILRGATTGADLSEANLEGAIGVTDEKLEKQAKSLKGATMPDGKMYRNSSGAGLGEADLSGVDLSGVDLSGANLEGAILFNANLEGANLNKAWVTREQLAKAKSLKGATMPDGSKLP